MKILLHVKSLSIKGGGERALISLADGLAKRGHVVNITVCEDTRLAYDIPDGVNLFQLQPRKKQKRLIKSLMPKYQDALLKHVEQQGYDVVIGWLRFGGSMVGWLPKSIAAPRIVAMRNVPYNHIDKPKGLKLLINHYRRQWGFWRADRIFVQMPQFVKMMPSPWRRVTHVVPNAVPEYRGAAVDYQDKPHLVVAVSRLIPVKRLDALIKAFAMFVKERPDWRLEIWGEGKPEKKNIEDQLQSLIAGLDLGDSLQLKGTTDNIASVYERTRIFAHPSVMEGMSNSVAEAMAAGLPIIAASDCVGMEEMISHGKTGYMVEGDGAAIPLEQQIYRALQDLSKDPQWAESLGKQAQDFAQRNFSVQAVYDRWESELKKIVAESSGRKDRTSPPVG